MERKKNLELISPPQSHLLFPRENAPTTGFQESACTYGEVGGEGLPLPPRRQRFSDKRLLLEPLFLYITPQHNCKQSPLLFPSIAWAQTAPPEYLLTPFCPENPSL